MYFTGFNPGWLVPIAFIAVFGAVAAFWYWLQYQEKANDIKSVQGADGEWLPANSSKSSATYRSQIWLGHVADLVKTGQVSTTKKNGTLYVKWNRHVEPEEARLSITD